ncbi:pyrroline-5-carboxylate reductase [Sphingobium sp. H39-3-25]|uniref:pyrroline-5-carboxylate reductase n=1 Tax=Sphingobium arseniciresistens TaxID=3030834 RepID=UPI0023BA1CF2|nr:pyrroline-5-carboxylate reductase [Sphingobium arseniciresistens]
MTNPADRSLVFVGAGRMGSALIARMTKVARIYYIDPGVEALAGTTRLTTFKSVGDLEDLAGVIIATKPAIVKETIKHIEQHLPEDAFLLSIAAGVTVSSMREYASAKRSLIRLMPNLPVLLGSGVLVFASDRKLDRELLAFLEVLFRHTGQSFWLDSDELFDVVTALSGSGPAYFFRMAEAMALAAESMGFSRKLALGMAQATLAGAGALCAQGTASLSDLRATVTSPNGTTAAALDVLQECGVDDLVMGAMSAAARRSAELSN